jgi:zinc D-Ala-D-Ala dipeptidase
MKSKRSLQFILVAVLLWLLAGCGEGWAGFDNITNLVDAQTVASDLQVAVTKPDGSPGDCYLQDDAARMLYSAGRALRKMRPELRLQALDCARSLKTQRRLYARAQRTGRTDYVANPDRSYGSLHTYGCAIDLTLVDKRGRALDLGRRAQTYDRRLQPRRESGALRSGLLTKEQLANRLLLREVMVRAGFLPIGNEWWHFDCATPAQAAKLYPQIH